MLEKMADFFENRLDGYDEHMMTNIEAADEFYPFTAKQLPTTENCHILDLGCGTGLELEEYYPLNPSAKITGVDLSQGMLSALKKKFADKDITTIVQNINNKRTSMALGKKDKVLYGPGYIEDEIDGLKFKISAQSFYQVNPTQTEKLYNQVKNVGKFKGYEKVIDGYCGVGTIGLWVAGEVLEVRGIDNNVEAIKNANENANEKHPSPELIQGGVSIISSYIPSAGTTVQ